jgi:hypothetical protein
MPTAEQIALRWDRILQHVEGLREGTIDISQVPYNLKVDVLAHALDLGIIGAEEVPLKLAYDVSLSLIKGAPDRQRNRAADRGTEVHSIAERISLGEVVEIPPELENHVRSWQKWRDDYQITFVETEFTVYSPRHYYAGTGDFLAHSGLYPEWGLICGDYKTSESGIWPDIALQLAAIRGAEFIGRDDGSTDRAVLPNIKTFIGVQILGSGYKVVKVSVNEATFRVFLSAANVARWRRDFEQFALDSTATFVPLEGDPT